MWQKCNAGERARETQAGLTSTSRTKKCSLARNSNSDVSPVSPMAIGIGSTRLVTGACVATHRCPHGSKRHSGISKLKPMEDAMNAQKYSRLTTLYHGGKDDQPNQDQKPEATPRDAERSSRLAQAVRTAVVWAKSARGDFLVAMAAER